MISMRYESIPITTDYIEANEGYSKLINQIIKYCDDGDYVVISETPISTAEGNLVDESEFNPGLIAFFLCEIWSKYLFGYVISPLIRDKKRTVNNLRHMPVEARNHKEFIYRRYGMKYALMPTSEAGVDLSNVTKQYVSPLPDNPDNSAFRIKRMIYESSKKDVHVMIIDTDACYELLGHKYTLLPKSIKCIKNSTGIYGYLLKSVSKKLGPTILASTIDEKCDKLISIASICEEVQLKSSDDFFDTVYSMQEKFNTGNIQITTEMLHEIKHIPAVILRIK
ncbi:MAG: hypothetical protein BZ133_07000 [Methanosphaera sp. SHI613]|nr:MAG: hypothetical protein BZ133_07000 [Methanosphaera sp. SHI613]